MMRKRGRENPCFICGHYHKFEEGEVCGVCGHRKIEPADGEASAAAGSHLSAFPTEVVPDFLYLGTYDNASRSELLKAQGISHILNAVATCPNLYRNSFTYFSMPESTTIPFDDCFEFLEQARTGGARVLVHCMSCQSRSPSIVAAYLMRKEGISLVEAVGLVRQKRPSINIAQALMEQLVQYEACLKDRAHHQPGPAVTVQQPQQQQQQQPTQPLGFLQFDVSALGSARPPGPDSSSQGQPTFLGGAGTQGAQAPQPQGVNVQAPLPGAGGAPPLFAFPTPFGVPPAQGFVFGASQAPSQGSGQ